MPDGRPFRLGVTGGIASGKSSVMAILSDFGAETIDADRVYHGLIAAGQPLHRALVARWGDGIVAADGSINRRALGNIVFSDTNELAALDHLTHPAIRSEIDRRYNASVARVVAIDAIKLIESGHADQCDAVWLVVADPVVQLDRLVKTRDLSEADARRRVDAQPPLAPRIARADVVIQNNGARLDLHRHVVSAWRQLGIHNDVMS